VLRDANNALSILGGIVASNGLLEQPIGEAYARLRAQLGQAREMAANNPGSARVLATEVSVAACRLRYSRELRLAIQAARCSKAAVRPKRRRK
jgi:hypothetical protein